MSPPSAPSPAPRRRSVATPQHTGGFSAAGSPWQGFSAEPPGRDVSCGVMLPSPPHWPGCGSVKRDPSRPGDLWPA